MGVKNYKELKIWQKGVDIVNDIYKMTKNFPKEELFGLTTQMRRSAISIPSNIAKGFMRQHNKEYIQFLYVALGSCAELDTQMIICFNHRHISENIQKQLSEDIDRESRMLMSMIKSVNRLLTVGA